MCGNTSRGEKDTGQKKTRAMVARSNEDGEEAFYVCECGETQIKWKLQKKKLNRLTSNDEAI